MPNVYSDNTLTTFSIEGYGNNGPSEVNLLNAELNPICHLLALLGGATIVVVSKLRVNIILGQDLLFKLNLMV